MAAEQGIPPEIIDEASRWVTDRDAGLLRPEDERALAAWLAADPRHALAYWRADKLWRAMGTPQVRARVRARRGMLGSSFRQGRPIPRRWIVSAVGASFTLTAVGIVQDWPTSLRADAMTATGERRSVALIDGSTVMLNTDSAIAIDYRADRRLVKLLKGEAAFTVSPDPDRPFSVEAGGGATTAIGTRFNVRRDGAGTAVAVTEHSVRVAWPIDREGARVTVTEGQAVRYGPTGFTSVRPVDVAVVAAWTKGYILFVDRPLNEVVAELARYHRGYITVLGADLAQRRVSGIFRTTDPVGAVGTLQRSLGVRVTHISDRLIFLHN